MTWSLFLNGYIKDKTGSGSAAGAASAWARHLALCLQAFAHNKRRFLPDSQDLDECCGQEGQRVHSLPSESSPNGHPSHAQCCQDGSEMLGHPQFAPRVWGHCSPDPYPNVREGGQDCFAPPLRRSCGLQCAGVRVYGAMGGITGVETDAGAAAAGAVGTVLPVRTARDGAASATIAGAPLDGVGGG